MPYIFRHHVRRWGVWGLGFALLVGVGCKSPTAGSSDAPKGWKMPGASLFHKKPAESSGSAEASASDSGSDAIPTAPPIPPGATAATSAAEARALLFGEKPGSGVVLTSAVESQPTVRGPNMSGVRVVPFGAKAALAHAQQPAAPATPAQPAAASSNSTAPAATPSAEETAFTELPPRRSAWVDPWASTETAS
ncbi:MAG TPA: hypothetical protein VGE52_08930, partial [Pirellulales bacterium]